MKLSILLFFFCTLNISAQDSLKFKFTDTVFVIGQERIMEFRWEFCVPSYAHGNNNIFDSIEKFLRKNENINVSIINHTDTRGSLTANKNLSEERAKAIKSELVLKGISEDRINALGMGESEPIHSERFINQYRKTDPKKCEQLHQINRRTVIRIIKI